MSVPGRVRSLLSFGISFGNRSHIRIPDDVTTAVITASLAKAICQDNDLKMFCFLKVMILTDG